MTIAIIVGRDENERKAMAWFSHEWKDALLTFDSKLDVQIWPDIKDKHQVEFAMVWNHPLGLLNQFPELKVIHSLAAGVDHIFIDNALPTSAKIARIVDPFMAKDIVQYVVAYVLKYIKRIDHWAIKQQEKIWFKQPPFSYNDKTIGVMGSGHLGQKAAETLAGLGLSVVSWSSSPKIIDGITHFAGPNEFSAFLSRSAILICMLPLTPQTQFILNKNTFAGLPTSAYLINIGRGHHLVEEDLLSALAGGQLSGACLDVFQQEPLPADHPFWIHPKITITPHIASVTNAKTAAPQLYNNYLRYKSGQALDNEVDKTKGY